MNLRLTAIVVILAGAVIGLSTALGVVLAPGDGDAGGAHMSGDNAYQGMMGAMGDMDSDAVLAHMRDALGEDGYQRMLEHWADHQDGGPMMDDAAVDGMMHQMMDSMMENMPVDRDGTLPRRD